MIALTSLMHSLYAWCFCGYCMLLWLLHGIMVTACRYGYCMLLLLWLLISTVVIMAIVLYNVVVVDQVLLWPLYYITLLLLTRCCYGHCII